MRPKNVDGFYYSLARITSDSYYRFTTANL
jgi:hypothetical protein